MKTVIEMARSVGATAYKNRHYPDRPTHTFTVDQLEHFAELARADERARIAEQPQQEPVRLRRGDLLRCIETDELCTVWATSTTGKTLIKWSPNNFGNYTAEQIGELFWLEPAQQQEEPLFKPLIDLHPGLAEELKAMIDAAKEEA